jgi:hypothetical protein
MTFVKLSYLILFELHIIPHHQWLSYVSVNVIVREVLSNDLGKLTPTFQYHGKTHNMKKETF